MKLDKKLCKVIADLEYEIGSRCYNPNSYNGWTGEEGLQFRYPIHFPYQNVDDVKTSGNINHLSHTDQEGVTPDIIEDMHYKFGSNHLYIGQGLEHVLIYLEKRYKIDFNKLEGKVKDR